MGYSHLERAFRRMGAELCIRDVPTPQLRDLRGSRGYTLDILPHKGHEAYHLSIHRPGTEFLVLNQRDDMRHLLLMSNDSMAQEKRKLLCGHDERHWFVAGVQPKSRTVLDAMESLKPVQIQEMQMREQVRGKVLHSRSRGGFIRQGEWFFLPQPDLVLDKHTVIHRHEPLRRGGGKPHMVEELMRTAGELVYVCHQYSNGLTEQEREALFQTRKDAKSLRWVVMRRNALVYVRGRVSHLDHATVMLPYWHQVLMASEVMLSTVAFLD